MCETLTYPKNHRLTTYATTEGRDPTMTTALRNSFAAEMGRRFDRIRSEIWKAVVTEDVFGLRPGTEVRITVQQTPGRRRFAFRRSSEKVALFMDWLRKRTQDEVLDVSDITQVGTGIEAAWSNKFINRGYGQGVVRARQQIVQAGAAVPTLAETGGLSAVMAAPVHADRVGLLYTRLFTDLKGITDAMDSQISRVLSEGMSAGRNPRTIARRLNAVIERNGASLDVQDTLGRFIPAKRRAKILARTEIIRAHAEAQLQEFENWKVSGVSAKAEWVTAGFNVCPLCLPKEGKTFPIEEARGMIPFHPQCRCAWIPLLN